MDYSLWPSAAVPWSDVLAGAEYAERTGWHGVWIADHFMPNRDDVSGPVHECLALLTGIAVRTERVRIGSMVLGNTYRHPAVVAKQAATLDEMSGGRFVLGIGAGWQVNEHEAYGIELPPVRERLARFDEACQVITGLLARERTTFDGTHYRLADAPLEPKPARLPVLIGAAGEKVALGIVARHADEWNHWGLPDLAAHKGRVFAEHCARIDRDPSTVRRTAQAMLEIVEPDDVEAQERRARLEAAGRPVIMGSAAEVLDVVARYPAAGIDELLVPDMLLGTGARREDALERLRTEVLTRI
ncbi:TIGR03560 family F420-dependent LLM class oxidoreductase [Pseudonocardia abyssalis]|uniref:TIGR03560 family F420-dependent LLM class oxidoreductase n=1 Tax=Pseudonocardia abyssalis TaxID=2792008 RepID=A0ABS6UX23_9PSEU|nr:TIGR03560 family F420-dependent LLM class oxidoreductase [Pseudonocardia abyssalis]MBW0115848.1 TIGR03560 family F420-dependent LLM class oxidoreductase [Pseudonocardia abyssalis]MBW0136818.1 TIGR03560 family F420-dependent LLM class oxidoreductase [Pseudonocardia abyssalis]